MKILLDPQIYNMQRYGGISKYYTEVFSLLVKSKDFEIVIPLNNSINVHFNDSVLNSFKQKVYKLCLQLLKKAKLNNRMNLERFNNKQFIETLKKGEFDLYIPTYYDTLFLNYIGEKPFVLTVYDMIHELFPEYYPDAKIVVANKLMLMEKAKSIIAVSENTKKDILKIYPHLNGKEINVIYHGSSIKVEKNLEILLPEKYILFVGNRTNYKNFRFFLDTISDIILNTDDLYLVCAGGGIFSTEENKYIAKLGLENKVVQKYFNDIELGLFYKKAICFVFPSIYEGFGIPVLESMICGCPVVLARHSSFPEVAGEAGVYYEFNNANDLNDKIQELIYNDVVRDNYRQKGFIQAEKFKWENAKLQCEVVYKKACEN